MPQVCWILYLNLPSQTLFATGLRVLELFEMCPVIQIRHNSCISTCMCPTFTFESSLNRLCKKVVFPTPMFPSTHSVNSCHKVVKQKNMFVCVRIAFPKVSSKTITSAPRAFLLLEQLTEPIALKQAGKVGCALQYLGWHWIGEVHSRVWTRYMLPYATNLFIAEREKFWSLQWPLWTSNLSGATTCRITIQMKWNVVSSVWDLSTPDLASLT